MVAKTTLPRPRPSPRSPNYSSYDNGIYYPDSDDEPMADNGAQAEAMVYVATALKTRYEDRDDVNVIMNMFVYYVEGKPEFVFAPDVGVMLNAVGNHTRFIWRTWLENDVLPAVIIEIASPNTWRYDAGDKRELYASLGIGEYWRADPIGDLAMPVLVGERLVNGRYEPIDVSYDESGILRGHSDALGLDFCIRPDQEPTLRLYDPEEGEWLPTASERAQAHRREAEARQLEMLRRRRAEEALEASEAEVRALREQIARMRG